MVYKVLHYTHAKETIPSVFHHPFSNKDNNVLSSGELDLVYDGIDILEFTIGPSNILYGKIEPLRSIVEVINTQNGKLMFRGRVLKPKASMSSRALFSQSYVAESLESYLYDSVQTYAKLANTGDLRALLEYIINIHNQQVEDFKRFKIGQVTMTSTSDLPFRYLDYGKTMDVIKDVLLGQIGGVLRIRYEADGMYLDWLEEYGEFKPTKIKPTENLKSAYRETNFDQIITKLMPVGATLESSTTNKDTNATHQRLTISSVNGGSDFLEDRALIEQFGVIANTMDWADIDDATILKARGQQFLDTQRAILTSWEVEVSELALQDSHYEFIEVGNSHPIDAQFISGLEVLKVVEKKIDLITPYAISLTIGESIQTLAGYQNALKEANKSIQKVNQQLQLEAQAQNKLQSELTKLQGELALADTAAEIEAIKLEIERLKAQGGTG